MSDMIDKAEALVPCPFCGGEETIILNGPVEHDWCAVSCDECHARGPIDYTDPHAIAAWNRRAIPARGVGVKDFDVEVVRGNAGGNLALYFNDYRVSGGKPWGGGTTIFSFSVKGDDVKSSGILAPTDAAQAREAALREAASVIQHWWADSSDNREPAPLILALIGEPRT